MNESTPRGDTIDVPHRYDEPTDVEPAVRVVEVVAAATDRDPCTLPPLHDVVDPEALNALVGGSGASLSLEFDYAERTIALADGELEVRE